MFEIVVSSNHKIKVFKWKLAIEISCFKKFMGHQLEHRGINFALLFCQNGLQHNSHVRLFMYIIKMYHLKLHIRMICPDWKQ